MRRIAVSLALFLCVLACSAQWARRGSLEFSAGPAFPFGDFSYNKVRNPESGYAGNGICLSLAFNYRLQAHLGLVAMISGIFSPVDESSIANKYWQPGFGYDWTVESTNWISNAYLAGLDIILPIYRSDFSFRILAGFASTRLPGLTGSDYNYQREASTDIAAAWSAGAGMTYQCFEKVTLSFRMDFFRSYPVLEEVWSSDIGPSGSRKISQKIGILNLTAGLGFWIF